MAIPTSRSNEPATILIDQEKCNGCGLCVDICKDFSLKIVNKKVALNDLPKFGCIGCGHCMAICPQDAIKIEGRFISEEDLIELPEAEEAASYESLTNLMKRRRSTRVFKDKAVDHDLILKILEAAQTAPMGIPPSDVNVLVMEGKDKVFEFSKDYAQFLKGMRWMSSKVFLTLMRPFLGKATSDLFKNFLRPLFDCYIDEMSYGNDLITYDAPVALYFYGSSYCDPADPIIAATYAMHAAESMGLGTCMLGAIHPMIQNGSPAKRFREKYNIRYKSREGIVLILGYSKYKFKYGIKRTFANIDFLN
ncbi:MAG: nitroreductase family protein [Bacteroidota bacterium]|nr:nitroreductase family protein [Bacteroidota bacterium]MDP4204737.1 nitroreductase family protein [Bacteroidota bacterium]